jgi:GNAT superfamily N-acetyltransferase
MPKSIKENKMLTQRSLTSFFPPKEGVTLTKPTYTNPAKQRAFKRKVIKDKENVDNQFIWNDYVFKATNNFTHFEVTTLITRSMNTKHFDPGFRVASAEVDDDSALINIEVHKDFRRQGIGTRLIKFMNKVCEQFHVYLDKSHNSRYRLTEEGAALIYSCEKHAEILDHTQIIETTIPPSPTYSLQGR